MPSFGSIKILQSRCPGATRPICKKALEDHGDDIDAAAKHISETTEFKDIKEPPAKTSGGGGNLSRADFEAGRACLEILEENTTVTVIRMEQGDCENYPEYGDTLHVHYKGMLQEDGKQFDSSYDRNELFKFKVGKGEVIPGWDEALMKMSLDEKALILIPAAKAYGEAGASGFGDVKIPPGADLKFEIQLLQITKQTSCLGAGRHGGVQKDSHEYSKLANQLLGRA